MPGSHPPATGFPARGGGPPQNEAGARREPQPLEQPDRGGAWPPFLRSLALDAEFLLLGGALVALCGWFILESGRNGPMSDGAPPARPPVVAAAPTVPPPPIFSFVVPVAREKLVPAMAPSVEAAPSPAGSVPLKQPFLLEAPAFDPLGSLILSGLPAGAHLSAGAPLPGADAGTRDWHLTIGEFDQLVIELPWNGSRPIRTTFDLLTRTGVKITSLTVEVREGGPDAPPPLDGAAEGRTVSKAVVRPSKAVRPSTKSQRKSDRPAAKPKVSTPPLVFPGDAPVPKGALPKPAIAVPALPPSGGLFKPDPKDSASSGLPADLREDPRFMTLRGLGMPPSDFGAAPGPTSAP
jgi:hypothetical protein